MKKNFMKVGILTFAILAFFSGVINVSARACSDDDGLGAIDPSKWAPLLVNEEEKNQAMRSSLSGYLHVYSSSDTNGGYIVTENFVQNRAGDWWGDGSGFWKFKGVSNYAVGANWYEGNNANRECDSSITGFTRDVAYAFGGNVTDENDIDYPLIVIIDEKGSTNPSFYFSQSKIQENKITYAKDVKLFYVTRPQYYEELIKTLKKGNEPMDKLTKGYIDGLSPYFSDLNASSDYSNLFNAKFESFTVSLNYPNYQSYDINKMTKMSASEHRQLYNWLRHDVDALTPVSEGLTEVTENFAGGDELVSEISTLRDEYGGEHPLETQHIFIPASGVIEGQEASGRPVGKINGVQWKQVDEFTFGNEYDNMFDQDSKTGNTELPVSYSNGSVNFDFKKTITYYLIKGAYTSNLDKVKQTYNEYYRYMKYAESVKCDDKSADYCSEEEGTTTGFAMFASRLAKATEKHVGKPVNKMYELAQYGSNIACSNDGAEWEKLCEDYDELLSDIMEIQTSVDSVIDEMALLVAQLDKFKFKFNYGDDGELECSTYISEELGSMLSFIYFIVELVVVILTVFLSMLDFGKAVAGSDQESMKKAWTRFIKRIIVVAVLILLPTIINWILVDVFKIKGIDPNNPICVNTNNS